MSFPSRQIVLALIGVIFVLPAIFIPLKLAKLYPKHFNNSARLREAWSAADKQAQLAVMVLAVRYFGWLAMGLGFLFVSFGRSGYLLIILGLGFIVASVVIRIAWWLVRKLE